MSSFFSETANPIPIKFSQYLCLADLSGICSNQFDHSSMTSSTRHFVFWPSKPIIKDIFNTKHHKSIKLGTHKLHVIIYQIMSHDLTCASLRTHTRASKFKNAPIDLEFFLDTFQTISSISKISARACPCVRFRAHSTYGSSIFHCQTCFWIIIVLASSSSHLHSLWSTSKAVRAQQTLKSARASMAIYSQNVPKWSLISIRYSSFGSSVTPTFYDVIWMFMNCKYDFMR